MGLFGALAVVALALVTALVAEQRGQSGTLWLVAGLLLPGVALLLALLLRPVDAATEARIPTPAEAARRSSIARALAGEPRQSVRQLALAVGADDTTVIRQLSALTALGLARDDATGRWSLTDAGVDALAGRPPPDRHGDPRSDRWDGRAMGSHQPPAVMPGRIDELPGASREGVPADADGASTKPRGPVARRWR